MICAAHDSKFPYPSNRDIIQKHEQPQ